MSLISYVIKKTDDLNWIQLLFLICSSYQVNLAQFSCIFIRFWWKCEIHGTLLYIGRLYIWNKSNFLLLVCKSEEILSAQLSGILNVLNYSLVITSALCLLGSRVFFLYHGWWSAILVLMSTGRVVLQAAILTAVAVLGLTLFTFWAVKKGYDFTFMFPFLFTCLNVLLVYLVIQVCLPEDNAVFRSSFSTDPSFSVPPVWHTV